MTAQDFTQSYKDRFSWHFQQSIQKVIDLAETMPQELYDWAPDDDAMPVGQVYMHIARHNYILPEMGLNIEVPSHIDPNTMEQIRDKDTVVKMLKESVEYIEKITKNLTSEQLSAPTEIFGEETQGWASLMLLINHMNEHVGQSVAYARMNGIVPPWSH